MRRPRAKALLGVIGASGMTAAGVVLRHQARADAASIVADPLAERLLDRAELGDELPGVVSRDGTPIHVRVLGPTDAPTVVLAHGWTCSGDFWRAQQQALGDELRLVVYDQRGHGRSVAHPDTFGTDALADDLDAVLGATLAPGQRAILVGHSMGAMAILAWAQLHAGDPRVAAALLSSTGVGDLVTESLLVRLPPGLPRLRSLAGRLFLTAPAPVGRPSPVTHRAIRYVALSRHASPAQVRFCERIILQCPTPARAAWGRSLTRLDLEEAVAHLTAPTTVVVGDADRLTPPVHARRLAEALPRLERLVVLPGVGHMAPVEAPDEFDAEIRSLVARHLPRRPARGRRTRAAAGSAGRAS